MASPRTAVWWPTRVRTRPAARSATWIVPGWSTQAARSPPREIGIHLKKARVPSVVISSVRAFHHWMSGPSPATNSTPPPAGWAVIGSPGAVSTRRQRVCPVVRSRSPTSCSVPIAICWPSAEIAMVWYPAPSEASPGSSRRAGPPSSGTCQSADCLSRAYSDTPSGAGTVRAGSW